MSYYAVFKPKKEQLDELYSCDEKTVKSQISDAERTLKKICLKDTEGKDVSRNIEIYLRFIEKAIESDINQMIKDNFNEDNEFWFCGWEYARESQLDYERVFNGYIENLSILAEIVKTPDYFEDREKFDEKVNAIQEELEGFEDFIYTEYRHKLCEQFKDCRVPDDAEEDSITDSQTIENITE